MSRSGDDPMPDKLTSRARGRAADAAALGRAVRALPRRPTDGATATAEPIFDVADVNVFYGEHRAIRDISMRIARNEITALIGPRAAASRPSSAA